MLRDANLGKLEFNFLALPRFDKFLLSWAQRWHISALPFRTAHQ